MYPLSGSIYCSFPSLCVLCYAYKEEFDWNVQPLWWLILCWHDDTYNDDNSWSLNMSNQKDEAVLRSAKKKMLHMEPDSSPNKNFF